MFIELTTPAQVVLSAANIVHGFGDESSPRGQKTREMCNMTFVVSEPWQIPLNGIAGRNLRDYIGASEALQLVGQTTEPEQLIANVSTFQNYTDGGIFHGAYGIRIYGKLKLVIDLLKRDPDSRQAVLTMYNSTQDLNVDTRDVPCTLSMQFLIRDNKLCARTTMRSNDVWLGLPYDLIQFCALQGAVARALDLEMGWYSHSVGSLHLYEQHFDNVKDLTWSIEPVSKPYKPLWTSSTIENISRDARKILKGDLLVESTDFEKWLTATIDSGQW